MDVNDMPGPQISLKGPVSSPEPLDTEGGERRATRSPPFDWGVSMMDGSQIAWGDKGRVLVFVGLAVLMIIFELDNTTTSIYSNFSMSEFGTLSALGSISTIGMIVFAVVKVPVAKLSNVIGRGYTLAAMVSLCAISYILMASASGIGAYAAGSILYRAGQSGTNVMTTVIISDITSARSRGFVFGVSYFPFLITPWVSGLVVDSVTKGIGWRWGIAMFAVLMPLGACILVGVLVYYQQRAKKVGYAPSRPRKPTVQSFCSDIDLGGMLLFIAGFALLLLPLTIAGSLPRGWSTPWVPTLVVVGGLLILLALPIYEKFVAANPVIPFFYFMKSAIVLPMLVVALDSLGHSATHTYLYAWATVSHNMSTRDATFFVFANGVTQCLMGIIGGWIMLVTGRYKWLVVGGAVIRLIGYGLMMRLRGHGNSIAELFAQQAIQGVGSGIIQTSLLVPPQVVVPRAQVSQVLSLTLSMLFLGFSIGSAIAGGIYTNTFRPLLKSYLGGERSATQELVDELYNSITGVLPAWGTPERDALNFAYTEVTKNFAYTSLGVSILLVILCFFLPDFVFPSNRSHLVAVSGVAQVTTALETSPERE